jgi:hypothetical protein
MNLYIEPLVREKLLRSRLYAAEEMGCTDAYPSKPRSVQKRGTGGIKLPLFSSADGIRTNLKSHEEVAIQKEDVTDVTSP